MTKKTAHTTDDALFAAISQFAQQALADGSDPAELSYALTNVAVRIGLDLTPNASIAFAAVMKAVSDAAWTSGQTPKGVDVESVTTPCGTTVH